MVNDMAMAEGKRYGNDNGLAKRRRDDSEQDKEGRNDVGKRVYLKEATVTVDVGQVKDARAADIIKAVTEQIGDGRILAVRPKQAKEYEVTLEREGDTEFLMDGLTINGVNCEVKRLQNRDYVVSFMHLPVYIADEEILNKLEGWGVSPISKIKRRMYPGTSIEDGTRFVKTRFPKEVASLPYSTKIETAEGPQYCRVMHSHQVKTCRLCMSPDHVVKDCPDFKCFKCEERGHFARDCNAVMCPDCKEVLNRCECWMGSEEEEQRVGGQMHERDDGEQEEESGELQNSETTGITDTEEQEGEYNGRGIQLQQEEETWTQMDLTESLESALVAVDLNEQRNKEQIAVQQEGDGWKQMDLTENLQKVLDTVELNEQRNKDKTDVKEGEGGEDKEEKQLKSAKRRRPVKVMPNLEMARKKTLKEDSIKSVNKYDVSKDVQEMN